jgi:glyoxylase-like metal-dependent hydrolase (beta-lactamase superfamily II)
MYDRNFDELMRRVREISPLPIRYVLNTHHHDDHAGGNAKMMAREKATVISHVGARAVTIKLNQGGEAPITFPDRIQVALGGKQVEARHFGRGHTGGDAVIFIPARRTIHTGDLFLTNSATPRPYMDFANGGSAVEWPGTLDGILATDFDRVIPGHGPLSDRAGIVKWRAEMAKLTARIRTLVRGGATQAQVEQALIGEFHWPEGGLAVAQAAAFMDEVR